MVIIRSSSNWCGYPVSGYEGGLGPRLNDRKALSKRGIAYQMRYTLIHVLI